MDGLVVRQSASEEDAAGLHAQAHARTSYAKHLRQARLCRRGRAVHRGGTGSSNTMMIPPNRPHPNAAKLWVNWFLSKEGATVMHELSETAVDPTLRLDVASWDKTDEFARRIEGKKYFFFGSDPLYTARREEGFAFLRSTYAATR